MKNIAIIVLFIYIIVVLIEPSKEEQQIENIRKEYNKIIKLNTELKYYGCYIIVYEVIDNIDKYADYVIKNIQEVINYNKKYFKDTIISSNAIKEAKNFIKEEVKKELIYNKDLVLFLKNNKIQDFNRFNEELNKYPCSDTMTDEEVYIKNKIKLLEIEKKAKEIILNNTYTSYN